MTTSMRAPSSGTARLKWEPPRTPRTQKLQSKKAASIMYKMKSNRPVLYVVFLCLLCTSGVSSSVHSAPPFYSDKSNLLVYKDADGTEHQIATTADWAKRRQHILLKMQEVM